MPKKPDNVVGQSEGPVVGDGHQTEQQKALTEQSGTGKTDAERRQEWTSAGGEPGRGPTSFGGSSQGQADRMPAGKGKLDERATNPAVTPGNPHEPS